MPSARKLKIKVSKELGSVSALLMLPKDAHSLMVLSHGAGAPMDHPFMNALAEQLSIHGVGTLRFNFLYKEKGGGAPDRPPKAQAAIRATMDKAMNYAEGLTLMVGGKSFGGRMTSLLAAQGGIPEVRGIVYFGFPLHAPGKDSTDRAVHLKDIKVPQLFLQGTRDSLAKLDLMKVVCKKLRKAKLKIIEGGDHSFKMLKRSEKTDDEAIRQLAEETARFAQQLK